MNLIAFNEELIFYTSVIYYKILIN